MEVTYMILYLNDASIDLNERIKTILREIINEYDEFDDDFRDNMSDDNIEILFEIEYSTKKGNDKIISGFKIKLEEIIRQLGEDDNFKRLEEFIYDFGKKFSDLGEIEEVFKFRDDILLAKSLNYVQELFKLEMNLREIYSYIFLTSFESESFNLLDNTDIKLLKFNGKNEPNIEHFRAHFQNEFFFLLFKDYKNLDKTREIKKVEIIEALEKSDSFDELKETLQSRKIKKEVFLEFIAGARTKLDNIENIRNCVAHNRAIPNRAIMNYNTSFEELESLIKEFWGGNLEK